MKSRIVLSCIALMTCINVAAASAEKILHNFNRNPTMGISPYATLIADGVGNLYGTTLSGGDLARCDGYGCGVVFELSPGANSKWTEKVLHKFQGGSKDGAQPLASLVLDGAGNLYGTTTEGGNSIRCGAYGCGVVFELSPAADGEWSEKILHKFQNNGKDGFAPDAGLTFDTAGNLYGTTTTGGTKGLGTVFQLRLGANGKWIEKVLHSFDSSNGKEGNDPEGGLIFDTTGNLYGTTEDGGSGSTLYQLSPGANGEWTEHLLFEFAYTKKDGERVFSGLVFDASGNLYGTTFTGGTYNEGTVFQLSPDEDGAWHERVLHDFNNDGVDGTGPISGLTFDAAGNLYGTTSGGGTGCFGTVFELESGTWTETILHSFVDNGRDGAGPWAGVVFDSAGNLYGTTVAGGGGSGCGTLFEIIP